MDGEKRCSKCGEVKPVEAFSKGRAECRECRAARNAAYYAANREREAVRHATYRAANREKRAAWQAAYRAANREKEAAYRSIYHSSPRGRAINRLNKVRRKTGATIYVKDLDEATVALLIQSTIINSTIRKIKKLNKVDTQQTQ